MIQNAKDTLINNKYPNLPQLGNVIVSWFQNISFQKVIRSLDGAYWTDSSYTTINTMGVVQPAKLEELQILPVGTFSWEYLLLHCLPDIEMTNGQYIIYNNVRYKIMGQKDYSAYGFKSFILLEATKADSI